MIPRDLKITFALLLAAALFTGAYVWTLKRHARQAPQTTQLQQPVAPPTAGAPLTVALYVADDQQGALHREDASLSLPADPTLRAQAVLRALIARYTQKDSPHALPAGADIHDVYFVNGTAVLDLNDAFASGHRSGVMVEELTVLSLVQTLAANLPGVAQVKILVNGQERETLAGHADLADVYDVAAVNRVVAQMQGNQ
jgi:spore germination protein GerM